MQAEYWPIIKKAEVSTRHINSSQSSRLLISLLPRTGWVGLDRVSQIVQHRQDCECHGPQNDTLQGIIECGQSPKNTQTCQVWVGVGYFTQDDAVSCIPALDSSAKQLLCEVALINSRRKVAIGHLHSGEYSSILQEPLRQSLGHSNLLRRQVRMYLLSYLN